MKSSREGRLSRAFTSPLAGDICSQDQSLHPCRYVTKHLLETAAVKCYQDSTLQPLRRAGDSLIRGSASRTPFWVDSKIPLTLL